MNLCNPTKMNLNKFASIQHKFVFIGALIALFAMLLVPNLAFGAERSSWMSAIDPNVRVSQLTIPGTHDSACFNTQAATAVLAETQSWCIEDQLTNGIRAFDLRYSYDDGAFKIYHGNTWPFIYECYDRWRDHWYSPWKHLTLTGIFDKFQGFLKNHPDEFIIVNVQREKGEQGEKVDNALKAIYEKYGLFTTRTDDTEVAEVKGKIVLGNDFMQGLSGDSIYNRWEGTVDQKAEDLQQYFAMAPIAGKILNECKQSAIYTNLSWRKSSPLKGPICYASEVQEKIFKTNPFEYYNRDHVKSYGVVIYDFPSLQMCDWTISANDWAKK